MLYFPYMQKNKQIRSDHNINVDLLSSFSMILGGTQMSMFHHKQMFGFVVEDSNDPGFRFRFRVIVALYTWIMSL